MKLITGFFMAWGNFLTLPCPFKRWDDNLKNYMLGFLPSVGMIIGLIWTLIFFILDLLPVPVMVTCFVLSFVPFALCGFMHLDGFMDCSDAIMSRRSLEERQRILKDPHMGAFAVVSVVFLLLGFFVFLTSAVLSGISCGLLWLIPVVSRGISGIHVLLCRPVGHSQYAEGAGASQQSQKRKAVIIILIQLAAYLAISLWLVRMPMLQLVTFAVTATAVLAAVSFARHQLGGMSGDIAGFGIVWGELMGVLALAVLFPLMC